jgi:hypothetical protein
MAHQAIISTISTCLPINPFLGLQHEILSDKLLGDQLGAWYTPIALGVAAAAALLSGQAERFLAAVVIATPCPLLLAIPTAIIGAISLAARRPSSSKTPLCWSGLKSAAP